MNEQFYDLKTERLPDGTVRLTQQSGVDDPCVIDAHPAQVIHIARALRGDGNRWPPNFAARLWRVRNLAADLVDMLAAVHSLYEKALQLYSAEIDEEKMRTGATLENRAQNIHAFSASVNAFSVGHGLDQGRAKIQADVAMSAAETLAKVAAAALATRNSVVSVSAGV